MREETEREHSARAFPFFFFSCITRELEQTLLGKSFVTDEGLHGFGAQEFHLSFL